MTFTQFETTAFAAATVAAFDVDKFLDQYDAAGEEEGELEELDLF